MAIPELAISPLAPRIVQMFQNQNFKDFVKMLSALSPRASRDDRLRFMFQCHDVDRDGEIARSDLETMTRHLVGSSVSEEDFNALMHRAFEDLRAMRAERADAREGSARGVAFDEFRRALSAVDRTLPTVRVPVDDDA